MLFISAVFLKLLVCEKNVKKKHGDIQLLRSHLGEGGGSIKMKRMRTGKRVHMNVNVRILCIFLIEHLVHELFTILPKL